jgi:hypothetical protein
MKKIFIFLMINIVAISMFAQDWRKGNYRNSPPEYLVMVNVDGKMMMGENSELNPLGYGFTAGFQYKTPRKKGSLTTAHGFGGYLGFIHYSASDITSDAIGTSYTLDFSSYKNFSYVPMMLSYNFYLTHKKMYYYVGLDLGAQMMIGERDYKRTMTSYYNGENEIKISRFLPSGKIYLGAMYEINQDFKLRAQIGLDYIDGYKFDAITPYFYRDINGAIKENRPVGEIPTAGLMNLSASIGFVYSL